MNKYVVFFAGLISLTCSHVLPKDPHDGCKDVSPEVYCASEIQAEKCQETEFCKNYLSKSICERRPEAYCKTKETALSCGKEAFCLTWPDDSVTAVKILPTTEPPIDYSWDAYYVPFRGAHG